MNFIYRSRKGLRKILENPKVERTIVGLIVLDLLFVMFDLSFGHVVVDKYPAVSASLHLVNIIILSAFTVEIALKIYVYRWKYFASAGHWLDLFVVPGALVLNIIAVENVSALVILRLWRVIRVGHSSYGMEKKRLEAKEQQLKDTLDRLYDAEEAMRDSEARLHVALSALRKYEPDFKF